MNKEPRVYGSKWEKARLSYLRSHPLCTMCQRQGRAIPATVVDHITPHRLKDAIASGDTQMLSAAQKLFWDQANWQSLCKQHHDSTKQRIEKSGTIPGCDENGFPLDPNSHWRKRY